MTTEMTATTNQVIVVGMLDTMLIRDRDAGRDKERGRRAMIEVTKKIGRDREKGGRWETMALQVRSPYGGMFAMQIELEPDVPGVELVASAEVEALLAFEGTLQLKRSFDGRFAREGQDARGRLDRGLPTRALHLHVTRVREPNTEERRASSAVWLEGVVAEPPQVSRHPELPSIQLAGTILRVSTARPADFPGLPATIDETVEINVAIPTSAAQAEALYRQGNRVRIVGQLDCRMERQGGPSVVAKLAEVDGEWAQRKADLAGKPQELQQATRMYRRQRMRFEEMPRLYVLALSVALLEGEPVALEDTYEQRRTWVREQRQLREERRARTAAEQQRRAAAPRPDRAAPERSDEAPVLGAADEETHPLAGAIKATRPRRRVEAAITLSGNGVEEGANGEVEAQTNVL
jgi:hypothetical protein